MTMWIPVSLCAADDDAHTGKHEPYWAMTILGPLVGMANLLHYNHPPEKMVAILAIQGEDETSGS